MSDAVRPAPVTMITTMLYRDADVAVDFLTRVFAFDPHAVYRGDDGKVIHAELTFGNGMIMLGPMGKGEFGTRFLTMPSDASGRCTHAVYVIVPDIGAHHARAAAAGADIVMPLRKVAEGGRSYAVRDPEGHVWSFGTYDPWQ
jgi:uncharacterized glyoxalase superfamily protein PhnB